MNLGETSFVRQINCTIVVIANCTLYAHTHIHTLESAILALRRSPGGIVIEPDFANANYLGKRLAPLKQTATMCT